MSKTKKEIRKKVKKNGFKPNHIHRLLMVGGFAFISAGLVLLTLIYYPVLFQEISFYLKPGVNNFLVLSKNEEKPTLITSNKVIEPVDEQYGLVIPKIGANSPVIANVSPFNEKEYQLQLTKGVAHARDTAYPGEYGNTFIFAHSAANWHQANRYNAIFYLLTKLKTNDDIYLFYKGDKFKYKVTGSKIVEPSELKYLKQDKTKKTISLMTCWPPGTTFKRLIVDAQLTK
ncbi:hypothetical protein A2334_03000 [Candidatus Roizmanbacteria bacterium RIFOXYB2_FULL_38_10]|uniref:Sortase n=1 Tax=Candidatus Roizmanbacteria bacterium RIFOXYD1_FULL_38_12 TaxID=1802093 RepID=A0A1F7L076_9BACT|nr:MAG: hypothetical protein A3K47_02005 [Candidatus Roizmanbacteria bacterium RIFOXYA2_FULL_38_14]OGK63552.1 MAG: hypothetical protein A3K27_02005 [Candidatus Roizmanbacteria bacterium RIFOXYA1_FULL_37_12]OGK65398.1 MAG: hypothetical protein A3K38_02005 [Candidatus Roizmanbacteria bacterium RIFOXYB1_FULL_40_23]OGK69126.1 MAG: hypothetical protein A2334_03000 [Candidatus Roizmanbacteria bacterium RIFOXYB2_FULL_38_10]OGK69803.1 MAG: hypothetical protein A3K21_02010 [Candidatus Roizmanbacteria ba